MSSLCPCRPLSARRLLKLPTRTAPVGGAVAPRRACRQQTQRRPGMRREPGQTDLPSLARARRRVSAFLLPSGWPGSIPARIWRVTFPAAPGASSALFPRPPEVPPGPPLPATPAGRGCLRPVAESDGSADGADRPRICLAVPVEPSAAAGPSFAFCLRATEPSAHRPRQARAGEREDGPNRSPLTTRAAQPCFDRPLGAVERRRLRRRTSRPAGSGNKHRPAAQPPDRLRTLPDRIAARAASSHGGTPPPASGVAAGILPGACTPLDTNPGGQATGQRAGCGEGPDEKM